MGNKASLTIRIDNTGGVVQAGSQLKGRVFVFGGYIQNGKLMLTVDGKEKVAIKTTKPTTNPSKSVSRAERKIFSATHCLHDFQYGQVGPGRHHEFPFVINLPAELPASASYPRGTKNLGFRIQYKLRAQLGAVQKEMYITVQSAPLPDTRVPCMLEPTSFPVKGIILTRGTVTLGASVEDTHVGRGDNLELHLACHNESTADIQRVQIRLFEEMQFTAGNDRRRILQELYSISDVNLPAIEKHRQDRNTVRLSRKPRNQAAIYRGIHDALISGQNKISFQIPESARDSYSGHIIQIWHFIEIKVQTVVVCSNPAKTIPLRIGTSPKGAADVSAGERLVQPPRQVHAPTSNPTLTPTNYPGTTTSEQHPSAEAPVVQEHIPIVAAVALPSPTPGDKFNREQDVVVLSDDAIVDNSGDLSDLLPIPAPGVKPVSISTLINAMASTVSGYSLIKKCLHHDDWIRLFRKMSPEDYGSIIEQVRIPLDQTRAAALLAAFVNGGDGFTCRYAAAAVRASSEWNRSNLAQRLVPMCVDIDTGHQLIRNELNEWEKTITAMYFEDAIAETRRRRQDERQEV